MRPSPVYAAAAAGAATAVAVLHRRRQARFFSSARGGFGRRVWSGGKSSPAPPWLCFAGEGPSCLFVGPIETASKEMLEALYDQARDSYYSGKPLIVDDMFDKVELKLRLYGSKSVVKYPRCSLRRQSAYADAEEDPSQVFTLASIWILLFAFGSFIFLIPTLCTIKMTYGDAMDESFFLNNGRFQLQCLHMLNTPLFMGLGFLIGYPIASASKSKVTKCCKIKCLKLFHVLCGMEEETLDHLFVNCSYTRLIWGMMAGTTHRDIPQDGELCRFMCNWKRYWRLKEDDKIWWLILHTTIWMIWGEGNNRIFARVARDANIFLVVSVV